MNKQSNKNLNTDITNLVNQSYKYGFSTNIEQDQIKKGLNESIVRLISKKKNEPRFLLNFRLRAFKKWQKMECPEWAQLKFPQINFQDMIYYSAPKSQKKLKFSPQSHENQNTGQIFTHLFVDLEFFFFC